MTRDEATQRIELSRRVIEGWEGLDAPSGRPSDALRMISDEIDELHRLAEEHPALALEASQIATRYHQIAKVVRSGRY